MKKIVAVAACALAGVVSAANTFYWKLDGSTWGDPNNPANWDVGSAGGGNPSSLVPSSADSIYTGSYLFDLNGGSLTAGTIMYVNWDALRTVQVTNGTFTLATKMQTRSVHMDIWDGGKVVFPAGSSWIRGDGMGNDRYGTDVIHAGGRLEICGFMRPWHVNVTVEDGGYLLMNTTSADLGSSWFPNVFANSGTCDMPNGMKWSSGGDSKSPGGKFKFIQHAGTWKLGGNFEWFDAGTSTASYRGGVCEIVIEGGRIEATGRVTFPFVQTRSVAANASVTVDVAAGGCFDLSGFTIGGGASIVKTGAGPVFVDSYVPSALTVQEGMIGYRAAVTDAMMGGVPAAASGICFGAVSNRLDSFAGYQSLDWSIDAGNFSEGDVVFSSSNAAIREYVFGRLAANLPAASPVMLVKEGDDIVAFPNSYIYSITVADGVTNALDEAETVVTFGQTYVTTAPFGELTLQPDAIFNKYGGGTLLSSTALADFTGKINVREGVLSVNGVNQLGTQAEGGAAPAVRVYDGATLALEPTSATAERNAIQWKNSFSFTGNGHNGLGALLLNARNSQRNIFYHGATIMFEGDTLIGSTCNVNLDVVCAGLTMNGHMVTLKNLLGTTDGHVIFTIGSVPFYRPGHFLVEGCSFSMQSASGYWTGTAENTLTLTNSAKLTFYSTTANCKWTLVCHEGTGILPAGPDTTYSDAGNTNVNRWLGPVRLEGNLQIAVNTSAIRKGFSFLGPISGPGSILAKGCWVQLANPGNTFTGGVTAENWGAAIGGIASYAGGAIPCAATLRGTELRLMDPAKQYSLPALGLEKESGKTAVLNVNSAAGCTIGDLSGFGVVSNGSVAVTGLFTMPRESLEAGRFLSVDGSFTYASTARAAVDDLSHLARVEYIPVRAEGGVMFNGADTLESPLSIAKCWHFLPAGANAIALRFARGTMIVIK